MLRALVVSSVLLIFAIAAEAQQKPATHSKTKSTVPARQEPSAALATNLPSEDAVTAFLHETFGYDPQVTWKIASIHPSKPQTLAEVNLQINTPQAQVGQNFFTTSHGH